MAENRDYSNKCDPMRNYVTTRQTVSVIYNVLDMEKYQFNSFIKKKNNATHYIIYNYKYKNCTLLRNTTITIREKVTALY